MREDRQRFFVHVVRCPSNEDRRPAVAAALQKLLPLIGNGHEENLLNLRHLRSIEVNLRTE